MTVTDLHAERRARIVARLRESTLDLSSWDEELLGEIADIAMSAMSRQKKVIDAEKKNERQRRTDERNKRRRVEYERQLTLGRKALDLQERGLATTAIALELGVPWQSVRRLVGVGRFQLWQGPRVPPTSDFWVRYQAKKALNEQFLKQFGEFSV